MSAALVPDLHSVPASGSDENERAPEAQSQAAKTQPTEDSWFFSLPEYTTFDRQLGERVRDKLDVLSASPTHVATVESIDEVYATVPDVKLVERYRPHTAFDVLHRWEGEVQSVGGEDFECILRDLTTPEMEDEVAVFPIGDVSDDDRELLARGAVFYCAVGYVTDEFGQVARASRLRFRRLPAWGDSDIDEVNDRVEFMKEFVGGNGEGSSTTG